MLVIPPSEVCTIPPTSGNTINDHQQREEVNRCFILSDKTVEYPNPYGEMYTEWKAPKRVTNQVREDGIEKGRRAKVSFPLFLAIVGAVIFSVFVLDEVSYLSAVADQYKSRPVKRMAGGRILH
jgi:hypothetical protein